MEVVPKRHLVISALLSIVIMSLVMIFSGSLGGAAAWANVLALPVAITGVIITLRRAVPGSGTHDQNDADGAARHSVGPIVHQSGYTAKGDVIQVARDYVVRSRPGSGGR